MNNLKYIRELYGATQDEIAKVVNLNRATISTWENQDDKKASDSNLEKLSLFYGIGPEYFYDKPIDDDAKSLLINSATHQREIEEKSNGTRHKSDDFSKLFSTLTFEKAITDYMTSMKLLLATAEEGSLEKLEIALKINQKMGKRLESVINIRKSEQDDNESLSDLIDSLSSKNN